MARPAGTPPTFATDANYTNSPTEAWQGTPIQVEPSSGEKAQGITPGRIIPAQWLNWILGRAALWLAYVSSFFDADDEIVYPAAKVRKITIGLYGGQPTGVASWSPPGIADSGNYAWTSDAGGQEQIVFDLNPYVRHGQRLVGISMIALPGSDPGVGDRMRVGVYRTAALDFTGAGAPAAPTALCTGEAVGTSRTTVTATPAGTVIIVRTVADSSFDYFAVVTSTNALVNDELYGLELEVEETYLRNS